MVSILQATFMNPNEQFNKRTKREDGIRNEMQQEVSRYPSPQYQMFPPPNSEHFMYPPPGYAYPSLSYSQHFMQASPIEMQALNIPLNTYGYNNSETPMRDGLRVDPPNSYWKSIGQDRDAVVNSSQHRAEQAVTNNKKRREVDTQSVSRICSRCAKELESSEEGISFKDTVYHEFCFSCSECYLPLANTNYYVKGGAIHCQEHANDATPPRQFKAFMSIQPESYQIANYNIYPSPQITFDRELDRDAVIAVALVENETHSVVGQGFRNSDTNRELTVGVQAKTFTGLKLSKKSVIKSYLKHLNLKKPNQVTFCIKFTINNISWYSRSFKILSSCSQLPPHLRDTIRPFAVNNNGNSNGNVSPPPTVTSATSSKNRASPIEPPSITESEYLHSILPPPPSEISPPVMPPSPLGNVNYNNANSHLVRPPYKYSAPPPVPTGTTYPSPPHPSSLLQQSPSPLDFLSMEKQKALSIMRMMERAASASSLPSSNNESQNQDPRIT